MPRDPVLSQTTPPCRAQAVAVITPIVRNQRDADQYGYAGKKPRGCSGLGNGSPVIAASIRGSYMVLRECVCFMLLSFAPNMAPARNIQRCTRKHRLPRTGGHSCPCVYRQRLRYLCELMLARCTLPAARAATKAQTGASKPIIAIKITGGVGTTHDI